MKSLHTILVATIVSTLTSARPDFSRMPNVPFRCPKANGRFCLGPSLKTPFVIECVNNVAKAIDCHEETWTRLPRDVVSSSCWESASAAGDAACSKDCIVYPADGGSFPVSGECKRLVTPVLRKQQRAVPVPAGMWNSSSARVSQFMRPPIVPTPSSDPIALAIASGIFLTAPSGHARQSSTADTAAASSPSSHTHLPGLLPPSTLSLLTSVPAAPSPTAHNETIAHNGTLAHNETNAPTSAIRSGFHTAYSNPRNGTMSFGNNTMTVHPSSNGTIHPSSNGTTPSISTGTTTTPSSDSTLTTTATATPSDQSAPDTTVVSTACDNGSMVVGDPNRTISVVEVTDISPWQASQGTVPCSAAPVPAPTSSEQETSDAEELPSTTQSTSAASPTQSPDSKEKDNSNAAESMRAVSRMWAALAGLAFVVAAWAL